MKQLFLAVAVMTAAIFPVSAEMKHEHSMAQTEDMKQQMEPLEIKTGGFDISLDIMPYKDYQKTMKAMKMEPMKPEKGTTHHIAATIRKDGKKIENAVLNLKITGPDGAEEIRAMPYNQDMMFQHTGHFSMSKKGKYQLTVSFKIGTEIHQGLVHYEVK